MARRKKPVDESTEQARVRRTFEAVADNATRSEKVSWDRKMDNMVSMLAKLKPIEDEIVNLMAAKLPLMDEISALRHDMVKDCVHPYEMLTHKDQTVHCKFCNRQFCVIPK